MYNKNSMIKDPTKVLHIPPSQGETESAPEPRVADIKARVFWIKMAAIQLLGNNTITGEEYKRLHDMSESPDRENWTVAEALIEEAIKRKSKI